MKTEIVTVAVLLVGLVALSMLPSNHISTEDKLKKFASYDELKSFIKENSENYMGNYYGVGMMETRALAADAGNAPVAASAQKATDFSTTNVQVRGVDEADIVKNDGKYIYVVSGTKVVIVDAFPAENAKILSEIELNTTPRNIFINNDKLVVFGDEYNSYPYVGVQEKIGVQESMIARPYPYYNSASSYIKVYDVSDRTNPVLAKNLSVDGNYFDSRMIGDYVYTIINQPVYTYGDVVPLPVVRPFTTQKFPDIYYFDVPDRSYNFVNIIAVNVNNVNEDPTVKTYMLPYSQNLFVSANNIYLSYTKWLDQTYFFDKFVDEVIIPVVPSEVGRTVSEIRNTNDTKAEKMNKVMKIIEDYANNLDPEEKATLGKDAQDRMLKFQKEIAKQQESTIIHKIMLNGNEIKYETQGSVPGHVLNQFSMDEYNNYFRIATTGGDWQSQTNNLYVLDSGMNTVGKVEDLAPGERIYSVRFMSDRAYMVTFRQVDPLFVIDLKEPSTPKVLGFLKVTGVSDYLHPVDENHIIGIGKEATEQGRFLGLKMSLFDVTDVQNPKEISKIIIGDRGTDSYALQDHHAFLFNKDKGLLVLPVLLAEIKNNNGNPDWQYGEYIWQGAYVFGFSVDTGFTLRGKITHAVSGNEADYESYWGSNSVKRSLYMGNVLYTLSDKMIKMNILDTLEDINKINLPYTEEQWIDVVLRTEPAIMTVPIMETL
ncbi:beta-propeller domain-containing protein [archaeon]|nr:beta-propeller domain-containing protein [archaeon]